MKKIIPAENLEDNHFKEFSFCIECESDLKEFGLNPEKLDVEIIKKNFEKCISSGKLNGDICSKLYIAISKKTPLL